MPSHCMKRLLSSSRALPQACFKNVLALANLRSDRRDSHTELLILNSHGVVNLCSLEYFVCAAAHDNDQEGQGSASSIWASTRFAIEIAPHDVSIRDYVSC